MSRRRAARVVVLLVVAAGAVRCAAQGGSSNLGGESSHPHRPELDNVHDLPVTSDRCVVYTYYAPLKGAAHHSWAPDAIHQWRRSWSGAGWKPRVLTPAHARAHPEHDALEAFVKTLPTPNARDYESACFLRHLAVAVVGGGYLSDYDVVNVNLPPPPHCDWLPNDGELTTHEGTGIPSIVSGDAKAFETFVRRVMAIDVREVMRAVNTPGLVSDMVVTIYLASLTPEVGGREGFVGRPAACVVLRVTLFARRGGGTFEGEALSLSREMKRWSDDARRGREALVGGVHARSTVFTTPERVRQPPCDDRGVEVTPLVFHISNEVVLNYFGNAHRPSVMARWYDNLTAAIAAHCEPEEYAAESYAATFFPATMSRYVRAYYNDFLCAHPGKLPPAALLDPEYCTGQNRQQMNEAFADIVASSGRPGRRRRHARRRHGRHVIERGRDRPTPVRQ